MGDAIESFPESQLRDHVRTGIDAGLAAVPVVGGPVQVLVDAVLVPSIDRRREAWLRKLGELVNELSERIDGWTPDALSDDEPFVSAVVEASRIAMGTHLEEKLNLLKNCLANMALSTARDDFLDLQMFQYVDHLTPEHFVVLQYLDNPGAWFDARDIARPSIHMGAPRSVLIHARLPVAGVALEIVLRDLNDRGLADTGSLGAMMSEAGVWQGRVSDLGRALLEFVREV